MMALAMLVLGGILGFAAGVLFMATSGPPEK